MKRRLFTFALAALTIGLLGSCSKINERIDGLDKRVYDLENNKIASIEQQIAAINTSINELKTADVTINGKIDELKQASEAQQTLIDALKEADKVLGQKDDALEARIATLEGQVTTINGQIDALVNADIAINTRIDQLQSYVDTEIGKAKNWATETFATLAQYQQTADDLAALSVTVSGISTTLSEVQTSIAGLDIKIDGIDAALQGKIAEAKTELEGEISDLKTELEGEIAEAITTSETGLQNWVNEQLSAYYTAAQMDAEIDGLQNQIDDLKTDTDANKSKIEELKTKLAQLTEDLADAKTTIKTEYETAIATAINDYNGIITQTIQTKIDAVNATITALTGRVETLESDVATLKNDVAALKAMIQSITILPAYNDGSVEAVDGILTVNFVVSPASSLENVTKDDIKLLVNTVKTKAATYTTVPAASATVNSATGDVSITADISGVTVGTGQALTVAVNVKNGLSDFTSGTVPVYVAGPVLPAGALSGVFSVSATKKVYFSKGNLIATIDNSGDPTAWKFSAHQYDCLGEGGANNTIGSAAGDVDLFGWSTSTNGGTSTTNNYGIKTSKTASDYSGDFYDWGKAVGDGNTWRTLSKDEWTYLFNTRTVNGGTGEGKSYQWAKIDVNPFTSVFGMILYPDNYTGTAETSYHINIWASLEAAGCVFLPAAGCRDGSLVGDVGAVGLYRSSTAHNEDYAYGVFFNSSNVYLDGYHAHYVGFSVRLVTEVK